jgi:uncharacterized protein YndB with AHSA1/START domain
MAWTQATTIIHAPVETVWNVLNDIAHTPEWVVGLEKSEVVTDGDYGKGTIYNDYNRLGPFLQTTRWLVWVYEPMSRQAHVSSSAVLPTTMEITLTPVPEGTRLHMGVRYRLLPQLGFLSRIFEAAVMNRLLSQVLGQNQANVDVFMARQRGRRHRPGQSLRQVCRNNRPQLPKYRLL